jgi:hypothetical protein
MMVIMSNSDNCIIYFNGDAAGTVPRNPTDIKGNGKTIAIRRAKKQLIFGCVAKFAG